MTLLEALLLHHARWCCAFGGNFTPVIFSISSNVSGTSSLRWPRKKAPSGSYFPTIASAIRYTQCVTLECIGQARHKASESEGFRWFPDRPDCASRCPDYDAGNQEFAGENTHVFARQQTRPALSPHRRRGGALRDHRRRKAHAHHRRGD